jgi:HAMP domain-containing protein
MKLTFKWLLWFVGIGIYVMVLGGVFYYNLFKWTFDEKLKQDVIEIVKVHKPTIMNGLLKNPKAITFEEYDIMTSLSKDERISSVLYLSRLGTVRWHKESRFIGKTWDEFQKTIPMSTDAIPQSYYSKVAKVRPVPKQPFYEIAIPFTVRGEIIGVVDMFVSRAGAAVLIGSAMKKYVFGALGVLFLLGLPLYFFFHHYVISPMDSLCESIDAISIRNFDLRFPPRKDEIGELALSITKFLQKIRIEMDTMVVKNKKYMSTEQKWWVSLLDTILAKDQYVIVVDENNNILYADFELPGGADSKNIHLLDVIDSQQQNLLRLVGNAYETPDKIIEGETVFKGQNCSVKILHVGETSDISRTLIFLIPA